MSEPIQIENEMILASAGSGKTYALVTRYLSLLAAGESPETIVALTFTRKSAGEFFSRIVARLAEAASDPDKAIKEAESGIGRPDFTQEDFRAMLRRFLRESHHLTLGTLDSFFAGIVRNFPFEFGLSGASRVLDESEELVERERAIRRVFRGEAAAGEAELLAAFKLARFGQEDSAVTPRFASFIESFHKIYLAEPGVAAWGNADRIWDGQCPWPLSEFDFNKAFRELFRGFDTDSLNENIWNKWSLFRDALTRHTPGTPFAYDLDFYFKKLIPLLDDPRGTEREVKLYRTSKQEFTGSETDLIRDILRNFIGAELETLLRRTRGLWHLLRTYEDAYARLVRSQGKLTFFDLAQLVAPPAEGEPHLLMQPDEQTRLRIDFRLDTRYRHWLLDEFQDTSRLQWAAIENLVDEAIQDATGERTFFQVGDVKQAIYRWRGGDVNLFREIRDRYVHGSGQMVERPLSTSWRSSQAVIDGINAIFGNDVVLSEHLPAAVTESWEWEEHTTAKSKLNGCTRLYQVDKLPRGSNSAPDKKLARYRILLGLLEEIDPVGRGLECAILVRANKDARAIVDFIRAHSDIPVYNESDEFVAGDNPLGTALLSLFQFAAHPGDRFSFQHLQMTPLGSLMQSEGPEPWRIAQSVLAGVQRDGFEATAASWMEKLRSLVEFDTFNERRAREFLRAARAFDASSSRSIDDFTRYMRTYTQREPAALGVVQVMTIHKAKGLDFDVVFLPHLATTPMGGNEDDFSVNREGKRGIKWVMERPRKMIAERDSVLSAYRDRNHAERVYEDLCVQYVAMTRARYANYFIIDHVEESRASHFSKITFDALAAGDREAAAINGVAAEIVYTAGEADWFTDHTLKEPESAPAAESDLEFSRTKTPRHMRRTASGSEAIELKGSQLFSGDRQAAFDFGDAVHRIFETIEWLDDWSPPDARGNLGKRALAAVETCLEDAAVSRLLTRPSPTAEVWRERRFETVLDGEWISGAFDRVVIDGDKVTIIDFKTDLVADEDEIEKVLQKYRPQLALYRAVLRQMCGEEAKIEAWLVFTSKKAALRVDS